jgi:hypothetical protein
MKKICKYLVNWDRSHDNPHEASVELPCWAWDNIIDFEFQGSELYLWAVVDPTQPLNTVNLEIYGTGWEIANAHELTHLKTVRVNDFVWHIFIGKS